MRNETAFMDVPRAIVEIIPKVSNVDERGEYSVPRDHWETINEYGQSELRHINGRYRFQLTPEHRVAFEPANLDYGLTIKQGFLHLDLQLVVEGDGLVSASPLHSNVGGNGLV